ncbi:uncharacterized protein LOC143962118 [Lithobates pipiens]
MESRISKSKAAFTPERSVFERFYQRFVARIRAFAYSVFRRFLTSAFFFQPIGKILIFFHLLPEYCTLMYFRFSIVLMYFRFSIVLMYFRFSIVLPAPYLLSTTKMSDDEMACFVAASAVATFFLHEQERRKKRARRYWIHPVIADREERGQFWVMYSDLRDHEDTFLDYTRMSIKSFDELLGLLSSRLQRMDTYFRNSIPPMERLIITLRYLATGQSLSSIHYAFCVGKSTASYIIRDTCSAIYNILKDIVFKKPTAEDWSRISEVFWQRCNFPNCVGAIDGKHIHIVKPMGSGSQYFNYKKYFSFVLMAVADANYCFSYIDIGSYGSSADSIFSHSSFGHLLRNNSLDLPENRPLPGTNGPPLPSVFVGDEAFALSKHLLRPYSGHNLTEQRSVFNYRLTRARRVVECAFGILANKWRVLHTPIVLNMQNAVCVVKAACALHNFVRQRDGFDFEDPVHENMERVHWTGVRGSRQGTQVRDQFASYFMSPAGPSHGSLRQYNKLNTLVLCKYDHILCCTDLLIKMLDVLTRKRLHCWFPLPKILEPAPKADLRIGSGEDNAGSLDRHLADRVEMAEEEIQETKIAIHKTQTQGADHRALLRDMQRHVEDLDNRGRRHNIRVRGIPEAEGPEDLQFILQEIFNELLGEPPTKFIEMDRALRPKNATSSPRDVICRLTSFHIKEDIMRQARLARVVTFRNTPVQLFPDLSWLTLQKRRILQPLLRTLQEAAIPYRWGFPISLTGKHQGKMASLRFPEDLHAFCEDLGVRPPQLPDWDLVATQPAPPTLWQKVPSRQRPRNREAPKKSARQGHG